MKTLQTIIAGTLIAAAAGSVSAWTDNRFATDVISSANLAGLYYNDAAAVLGKPSTKIDDTAGMGSEPGIFTISMVYGAHTTDPGGAKVIATLGNVSTQGEIVVEFAQPIVEDPANWYGKEFIVYGNSFFKSNGYVEMATNMESYYLNNGTVNSTSNEAVSVSVSPDLINWYTYTTPKADMYWPINTFAWDKTTHAWSCDELDWTKPVPNWLDYTSFAGKSVVAAIDMYQGSAGGTAFDLAESGFSSIKYIRMRSNGGEVDGLSRVSKPVSSGQAKALPDGVPVSLGPQVVTAGREELGDCFYIESQDRSCGIKVVGKSAPRGVLATVSGVMTTVGGERTIRATWLETGSPAEVLPLGLSNRAIGGGPVSLDPSTSSSGQLGVKDGSGLNNIGLLVHTWGSVKSVDSAALAFTISDGSGRDVKCVLQPASALPALGSYVSVTGISTCVPDGGGSLLPVIRIRRASDVKTHLAG